VLNVIMVSLIFRIVVMLRGNMLSVVKLSVIMLCVVMLCVAMLSAAV
jgi:hypothetical protein